MATKVNTKNSFFIAITETPNGIWGEPCLFADMNDITEYFMETYNVTLEPINGNKVCHQFLLSERGGKTTIISV